ncbi:MAG: hypothetical protein ABPD24_00030 [Candidatus Shikimatogenerans sp. AspAUS03]|uniref:Exoribonuclease phosphorolytic domain-containing protein n=1 Tax=Candidatus Shikimatogenerans sp. AspAUS03 TaxID=3158563 RepID=A0AAU7QT08_9FLAO
MKKKYIFFIFNKKKIVLESNKFIKNNNKSFFLKTGNTVLLINLIYTKNKKEKHILPLYFVYKEKYYSLNKIPISYNKRDYNYTIKEILIMRILDRLFRPLFYNFKYKIQITIFLLSYDNKYLTNDLISLSTSLILLFSKIPYKGPVYLIQIIKINNKYIINPNYNQLKIKYIKFNLLIGGNYFYIIVLEGDMNELNYKEFINIIKYSHIIIKKAIQLQINIIKKKYIQNKYLIKNDNYIIMKFLKYFKKMNIYVLLKYNNIKYFNKIYFIFKKTIFQKIKKKINKKKYNNNKILISALKMKLKKKILNLFLLKFNKRLDNRSYKDIRKIKYKLNFLPSCHGSVLFTRGNTQILLIITISNIFNINKVDSLNTLYKENFYLQYNFNSFSVNEIKNKNILSRREIGHSYLAQKSFKCFLFLKNQFSLRIISEVLQSDGSSSMATVCATSLALINSGIYLKRLVLGISYGILKIYKKYKLITDLSEIEDNLGYMDFKITGTVKGLSACQLDCKKPILSINLIESIIKRSLKNFKYINNKLKYNYSNFFYCKKFFIYKKFLMNFLKLNCKFKYLNNSIKYIINFIKKKKMIIIYYKNKINLFKFIKKFYKKIIIYKLYNIYKFKIIFIKKQGIYISYFNNIFFLKKKKLYINNKLILPYLKKGDYINLFYLGLNDLYTKLIISSNIYEKK